MESPADERRHESPLPRGRHGLPAALVVANQRERIIAALAAVCVSKGYRAATVEDIIARAGVSRRTFYDLFSGKQDCFLVAFDLLSDQLFSAVDVAYRNSEGNPWAVRLDAALRALLGLLAAEPEFARLVMVEVLVAGDTARQRRDGLLVRFEDLLAPAAELLPLADADRRLVGRAVIGGLTEALYARIAAGATLQLPELRGELLYCLLVPYVGHARAAAARLASSAC